MIKRFSAQYDEPKGNWGVWDDSEGKFVAHSSTTIGARIIARRKNSELFFILNIDTGEKLGTQFNCGYTAEEISSDNYLTNMVEARGGGSVIAEYNVHDGYYHLWAQRQAI